MKLEAIEASRRGSYEKKLGDEGLDVRKAMDGSKVIK